VSSASVVYPRRTPYAEAKLRGEAIVQAERSFRHTIVRPTLVYDAHGGQEFRLFLAYLQRFPVVPFVGPGTARKRPVLAADVVDGLVRIAGNPRAHGKTYNLSGGEAISIRALARLMLEHHGGGKPFLHLPVPLCRAIAAGMAAFMRDPPLNEYTIAGMLNDADNDPAEAERDLGYRPLGVREGFSLCFGTRMGTLEGSPCPPAMGSGGQSPPAPDATTPPSAAPRYPSKEPVMTDRNRSSLLAGALLALFGCGTSSGGAVDLTDQDKALQQAIGAKVKAKIVWSSGRLGNHDLFVMNADGSDPKPITKGDTVDWFPRFSPDGSRILFCRSKKGWVYERDANDETKWDIWTVAPEGGSETKVVEDASWGSWLSADEILYVRGTKIFRRKLPDGAEKAIMDSQGVPELEGALLQQPEMSRDGKFLAITLRGSKRETGVWDLAKKTWTKTGLGCQINWTPDGSRIYWVNPTGNGGSEVFALPMSAGKPAKDLSDEQLKFMDLPGRRSHEYFPQLSAGGKWMVWAATQRGHDHDIADYEIYIWQVGSPAEQAARLTFHSANDRWPDIFIRVKHRWRPRRPPPRRSRRPARPRPPRRRQRARRTRRTRPPAPAAKSAAPVAKTASTKRKAAAKKATGGERARRARPASRRTRGGPGPHRGAGRGRLPGLAPGAGAAGAAGLRDRRRRPHLRQAGRHPQGPGAPDRGQHRSARAAGGDRRRQRPGGVPHRPVQPLASTTAIRWRSSTPTTPTWCRW
jgi:hypothetical protein